MAEPDRDLPFLRTRELFVLKLDDWPHLAERYLRLPTPAAKLKFLARTVDRVPRSTLLASSTSWTSPRDIGTLEWFASADDICRVYAKLFAASQRPGLGELAKVMEVNDGGIGLPKDQWSSVWFKGGSEPGVLTLNYLASTRDGRTFVVSVLTSDPYLPIAESTAAITLLAGIKGAFELAAGTPGTGT
jgi:hypothetical protein